VLTDETTLLLPAFCVRLCTTNLTTTSIQSVTFEGDIQHRCSLVAEILLVRLARRVCGQLQAGTSCEVTNFALAFRFPSQQTHIGIPGRVLPFFFPKSTPCCLRCAEGGEYTQSSLLHLDPGLFLLMWCSLPTHHILSFIFYFLFYFSTEK
jgi:hypothetical protein